MWFHALDEFFLCRTQDANNQLTPLLLAVQKGNEMIVRNLILAGAWVLILFMLWSYSVLKILQMLWELSGIEDTHSECNTIRLLRPLETPRFVFAQIEGIFSLPKNVYVTIHFYVKCVLDVLYICFSSVNEMTTSGQTSLHLAAESNLSDVCSILLSNGVDYAAVDSRGNNALHLAVKEGHIAVARVLVSFKVKRF